MDPKTPAEILAKVSTFADEKYQGDTTEAHIKKCGTDVLLNGYYDDPWETPMCGAAFKFYVNGDVFMESRLKDTVAVGGTPGLPLSDQQRGELGTFLVKDVPQGRMELEITQEATEAEVSKELRDLKLAIEKVIKDISKDYAEERREWDEADTLGKAELMGGSALSGYRAGRDKWLKSEKDFFASIGTILSDVWADLSDDSWEELAAKAQAVTDRVVPNPVNIARDGYEYVASGELDEDFQEAKEFYNGAQEIIAHREQIKQFMDDFVNGNDDGVERFITDTLPKLAPEGKGKEWADYIQNNYDNMQLVLELVRSEEARGLLMGMIPAIANAIPPHIWVQNGVGTITHVLLEVIVSVILGLMAAAAVVGSRGAAAPVSGTVMALRGAKIANYGRKAYAFLEKVFKRLEGVWKAAMTFAARKMAQGRAMSAATAVVGRKTIKRATVMTGRKRRKGDPGCRVCGKELGKNGHPKRSPSLNGVVDRVSGDTGPIRTQAKADPNHPISLGIQMQAHHVVSVQGVKEAKLRSQLKNLGYDIHVLENLSLIPSTMQGACHLGCQVHKSGHEWTGYSYHKIVGERLKKLRAQIEDSKFCDNKTPQEIQSKVDKISKSSIRDISRFKDLYLWQHYNSFRSGNPVGCGGVDGAPQHNPAVPCPVGRNHRNNRKGPNQRREDIKIAANNSYQLEVGR